MDYRRTHRLDELRLNDCGKTVTLSGWVHRRRDHGRLIFIDLRDRYGITQLIFDPDISKEAHAAASKLRSEWVLTAKGTVRKREEGLANSKLQTGDIEVEVEEFETLSVAKTPPFSIADDGVETHENIRLKYRYLDIRRGEITHNLALRHRAMMITRQFLDENGFIEINTPILGRSTPEGARDYLVPSRIYPGNFYALPQSPQLFKQLLMVSGIDRYFQIAPCFRDEDLRSDRQPEFTQIDLEMSFAYPSEIKQLMTQFLQLLFNECLNVAVPKTIREMSYHDCLENYGTDRPDLRFEMRLHRLDSILKECGFSVFHNQLQNGGIVKGLCVKGGSSFSRKDIETYTEFVGQFGLRGLAWMKKEENGLTSNIVKFFSRDELKHIEDTMEAEVGDLLLFAADNEPTVNQALDHLRRAIAQDKGLIDKSRYEFLWVNDFPLFERDSETGRPKSLHHPFTEPHPEDIHLLDSDPLKVRSNAYDIIINGYEVGGGSKRIHDMKVQEKIFQALKLSPAEVTNKFGFFTEALSYGTPPHLGIALGFDRLVMILTGTDNIRDVIAFPKTQKASDLMMRCPSDVSSSQLRELEIEAEAKEITWI